MLQFAWAGRGVLELVGAGEIALSHLLTNLTLAHIGEGGGVDATPHEFF